MTLSIVDQLEGMALSIAFFVIMIVSELSVVAPHFVTSCNSMRTAYIIAA